MLSLMVGSDVFDLITIGGIAGADLGSILRGVQHEKGTSTNGYLTRKGTSLYAVTEYIC